MTPDDDPLARALTALAVPAPPGLVDRIVDRWTVVATPVEQLFVAYGTAGLRFARTVTSVDGSADEFIRQYHHRFPRPLTGPERAPAGLARAARLGRPQGLRFDLTDLSPLERAVLEATAGITAGQTRPYAWVAEQVGRPGAVRAIAAALARNPVPVLLPCHRVLRSDARVGGHVLGPVVKERLLRAEGVDLRRLRALARDGTTLLGSDTTRIVCFPTCHHARRITAPHRVGFGSAAAAVRAGYRACKVCRPRLEAAA